MSSRNSGGNLIKETDVASISEASIRLYVCMVLC